MKRDSRTQILMIAGGAVLAAILSGCGEGDDLSAAVMSARNTLTALTGTGSAAAPESVRGIKYAAVVQNLQAKLAEGGEPATVSSANLLLAQATAGQGEIIAQHAREADGRLAAALVEGRALLTLCREQRALAASRAGYDPSASINGFEAQSKEKTSEISSITAELEKNEAAVKKLRDEAGAQSAHAIAKRDEERSILKGVADLNAAARLQVTERAAAVRREGDAFEMKAAQIEAEADRIAPRSDEFRRELGRAQTQKDSLAKARQSLLDLKKFTDEQVTSAREEAKKAEAALVEYAARIEKLLNEEVKPRYDEAVGKYVAAGSKAAAGRTGGSRQAVAVTGGTIQHALGALHRERAQSLARTASFFEEAGAMTPPVSDGAKFAELAKALIQESTQALTSAAENYASASGSFQGAGTEPYTRLAEQLTMTEKMLKGEPIAPATPEGEAGSPTEPPVEPAPPAPEQPAPESAPGH